MNRHCSFTYTNLETSKQLRSKADLTPGAIERKRLEIIQARIRLTKLASDYDDHIREIKTKLEEYQQIVQSIDLMIRIVQLGKDHLRQRLKEQELGMSASSTQEVSYCEGQSLALERLPIR